MHIRNRKRDVDWYTIFELSMTLSDAEGYNAPLNNV